eukprot:g11004.t1
MGEDGEGGQGGQPLGPSLAWEATIGAAIRESSGASDDVRRRELPRNTTDILDGFGVGLAAFAPPAEVARDGSPRRREGASSARVARRGSPRGARSPGRWSAYSEKRRLRSMAASARFRASMRQSAAERNEFLALAEEARRLQAARAERARRARLARQKIARYREERIHDLESRLARRCGRKPHDAGDPAKPVSFEKESRDGGNDRGSGGDERHDRGGGSEASPADANPADANPVGANPGNAGSTDNDSELQKLSRQRKEIEAAIAAAMGRDCSQDETPSSDRRTREPERPTSASRRRTKTQGEPSLGRQRRRRQRQSSGAGTAPHDGNNSFAPSGQQEETPSRPTGKPPRAPPRPGDRSRQSSSARRTSSVRGVDDPPGESGGGGSYAESFAWEGGACSDADEVRTEESGGGGGDGDRADESWRDCHLSDGEGSVWEEPFSFKGWEGHEDINSRGAGEPPALTEAGETHGRGVPRGDDPRRRQRHRVTGTQLRNETRAESWRMERGQAPAEPRDVGGEKMDEKDRGARRKESVAGNEGSCNSRSILSAEDEAQEGVCAENNAHAQPLMFYSGDEATGDDAFRERLMSDQDRAQGQGPGTNPSVYSGAAEDGIDDAGAAGGAPEYVDDFFGDSEQGGLGDDVPFAVSPTSDEDTEAFAAARAPSTDRNGAVTQPPAADERRRDRHQEHQEQFRADANTESNEWLIINEPPGRPRRLSPPPAAGENCGLDHTLLQPVLPTVLRYAPEDGAGDDSWETADAAKDSFKAEPVAADTGGRSGEIEHARERAEGQQPTGLLRDDTRSRGQARDDSLSDKPEKEQNVSAGAAGGGEVVAPLRIDSTALFASLSSSTAGATISSKSMAGVKGKGLNPTRARELTEARQGEGSSSTFALSADDDDDDDDDDGNDAAALLARDNVNNVTQRPHASRKGEDSSSTFALSADDDGDGNDAAAVPARDNGNNVTQRPYASRKGEDSSSTFALSADDDDGDGNDAAAVPARDNGNNVTQKRSSSLGAQGLPEGKRGSVADANEDDAVGNSASARESLESRVPQSPEHGNGVVSVEASRRSPASPSSDGAEKLDGGPVEGTGSVPAPTPHAITMTSAEAEPVRPSTENQPVPSLQDTKGQPQRNPRVADVHGESVPWTDPSSCIRSNFPSHPGEAAEEPATKPGGDAAARGTDSGNSTRLGRGEDDRGAAAGRPGEEAALDGRGTDSVDGRAEDTNLAEEDGLARNSATPEHEGSVLGASEERSLVEHGSSQSGSVLDVGGGGIDSLDDDDDGYF